MLVLKRWPERVSNWSSPALSAVCGRQRRTIALSHCHQLLPISVIVWCSASIMNARMVGLSYFHRRPAGTVEAQAMQGMLVMFQPLIVNFSFYILTSFLIRGMDHRHQPASPARLSFADTSVRGCHDGQWSIAAPRVGSKSCRGVAAASSQAADCLSAPPFAAATAISASCSSGETRPPIWSRLSAA